MVAFLTNSVSYCAQFPVLLYVNISVRESRLDVVRNDENKKEFAESCLVLEARVDKAALAMRCSEG